MTDPVRTLVVDDEESIRFFLQKTLTRAGHTVVTAGTGEEALERLRDTPFDLLMLDLRLGGRVDGLRILEAARWRWPHTAAVILTAHGSLDSALTAIQEGVDGYLLKPVEPSEVRRAANEALERRSRLRVGSGDAGAEQTLIRGPFSVDLQTYEASRSGELLDLTPRELKLLVHLMQNSPKILSPMELVTVVQDYSPEYLYEARQIIKWYIYRLRRKVEDDPSNPQHIVNVRGVGYGFKE